MDSRGGDARHPPEGSSDRGQSRFAGPARHRIEKNARAGMERFCRGRRCVAISTMRPRYITATRSLDVSDDAEVVRDETDRTFELLPEVAENKRNPACTSRTAELDSSHHR